MTASQRVRAAARLAHFAEGFVEIGGPGEHAPGGERRLAGLDDRDRLGRSARAPPRDVAIAGDAPEHSVRQRDIGALHRRRGDVEQVQRVAPRARQIAGFEEVLVRSNQCSGRMLASRRDPLDLRLVPDLRELRLGALIVAQAKAGLGQQACGRRKS